MQGKKEMQGGEGSLRDGDPHSFGVWGEALGRVSQSSIQLEKSVVPLLSALFPRRCPHP